MATEVQNRTTFPYSAVTLIVTTFPDGVQMAGTGVVVGVNDLLTALHVLYSPDNGGWASKVELYPGADFNASTEQLEDTPISVDSFTWEIKGWPEHAFANADNSTFTSNESQYDLAVIGLSTPLGLRTGWYGIAPGYDSTQWANVIGYSTDSTGMMSGKAYVERDVATATYYSVPSIASDLLSFGSSGGPLYIIGPDGMPTVIGIKSAGTTTSNVWADVGLLYDQIKAEIARNDTLLASPSVSQPGADQDATAGQAFSMTLAGDEFTSGKSAGPLTFSAKLATGAALPGWLHFDPATRTFSGTPSLLDLGKFAIRVTATSASGTNAFDDFQLSVGAFGSKVTGSAGNDILRGGIGNDTIDGREGIDTLVLDSRRADYLVTMSRDATVIKELYGNGGADTLTNVERLHFSDVSIALDIFGHGGQAYRLYQAAFNRAPDAAGLGVQINALDSGWSLTAIAQNFIDSPEFARTYSSLDDRAFVTQLYANALHRLPDPGGLNFHVEKLAGGLSRAQTLIGFSESQENQAALIGVMQAGINYLPFTELHAS